MEDGGDADAGAEVLRVSRDRHHRLRCCAEQQIVDDRLVLQGDVCDLGGKREDDMEVADRQQVGFTLGQPGARSGALAFGAMPIAAANGNFPLAAIWANLVMGSWRMTWYGRQQVSGGYTLHYRVAWYTDDSGCLTDGTTDCLAVISTSAVVTKASL